MSKRALVTGASGAIGAAIAQALAFSGLDVVLVGRSAERLEKTRQSIGAKAVSVVTCDLKCADAISEMVNEVLEAGPIHVLVNNAGIVKDDICMRMSDECWDDVINTNLKGAFLLTRGFLRAMLRERYGRVINVTSVVGSTGNPGQCNYAAAKAGLVGMSKALASEVGKKGITVNCIAPGFIESDMTSSLPDAVKDVWIQRTPVGRIGKPEEIGHAAAFLASEGASYITGHVLHVNGGVYCA